MHPNFSPLALFGLIFLLLSVKLNYMLSSYIFFFLLVCKPQGNEFSSEYSVPFDMWNFSVLFLNLWKVQFCSGLLFISNSIALLLEMKFSAGSASGV